MPTERTGADALALLRCRTLVTALLDSPEFDPAAFDEAVALVTGPLQGLPGQGRLAGGLVYVVMRRSRELGMRRITHLRPLLTLADTDPPPAPDWSRVRSAAMMAATMVGLAGGADMSTPGHEQMSELRELAGDDPELNLLHRITRMSVTLKQAMTGGDPGVVRAFENDLRRLREDIPDGSPMAPYVGFLAATSGLMAAQRSGDMDAVVDAVAAMREQADDPAVDPGLRSALGDSLSVLPLVTDAVATLNDPGHVGGDRDGQLATVRERLDRPDAIGLKQTMLSFSVAAAAMRGGDSGPAHLDAAVAELRSVVAGTPADGPGNVMDLVNLAVVLVRRSELTNTVTDLPEAVRVLERARTLAGGPDHPMWQLINEGLSQAHRRAGSDLHARRAALDGLKTFTWRVLLQPDLRSATETARDAAVEAVDVARWCLRDNEPGDAVRALDAGRGLLLFAATELRDLATRLADAGQPGLVDRWRAATATGGPDSAPVELRREVLAALTGTGPGAGLLDPPSLPEIRAALSTLDADALVYLVPGSFPHPGAAVIVPVEGPPAFISLANLYVDDGQELETYLRALNSREVGLGRDLGRDLGGEPADDGFADRVDELCDWAWRAATGPLLTRYLHHRPKPAHRPHRVFLVPMGELARVPWQAARHTDGTYALQAAAFSQVASARMLCESARRPTVPLTSAGLVVGDPDTAGAAPGLPAARAEGFGIHKVFYPGSRYIGRRPDGTPSRSGPGSRDDVLGWLAGHGFDTGSMLHLACHGVIQSDPATMSSHLLLANGDELKAEELVGTMAGHPDRAIALVVLAACRSGVSPYGYDEAYSLGTAFLAAGVRSVLSTQWSIPDQDTSVLAFMFHHFLVVERKPVWDALREAQLWMLDPRRRPPGTMPAPLRRQLDAVSPERVVSWAGFVHWGQ